MSQVLSVFNPTLVSASLIVLSRQLGTIAKLMTTRIPMVHQRKQPTHVTENIIGYLEVSPAACRAFKFSEFY